MSAKTLQKARIEQWYIDQNDSLVGAVYGHPRFEDGTYVRTSRVVKLDKATGEAVTRNTEYVLGAPLKMPAEAAAEGKAA